MKGIVKHFDAVKGFGFITNEDGKDIFAHYTGIKSEGFKTLEKGQEVVFDTEATDKGLKAVNIEAI